MAVATKLSRTCWQHPKGGQLYHSSHSRDQNNDCVNGYVHTLKVLFWLMKGFGLLSMMLGQ